MESISLSIIFGGCTYIRESSVKLPLVRVQLFVHLVKKSIRRAKAFVIVGPSESLGAIQISAMLPSVLLVGLQGLGRIGVGQGLGRGPEGSTGGIVRANSGLDVCVGVLEVAIGVMQ